MNINQITSQNFMAAPQGRKLVPLKKYEGPILRLTKSDEEKIAKERSSIVNLEMRILQMEGYAEYAKHVSNSFYDSLYTLKYRVETANEKIRNIKIARFEKQKKSGERL